MMNCIDVKIKEVQNDINKNHNEVKNDLSQRFWDQCNELIKVSVKRVSEFELSLKNEEHIFYLCQKAATSPNPHCDVLYRLATFYEYGFGTLLNIKKSMEYYEAAANNGSVNANLRLSLLHKTGTHGYRVNMDNAFDILIICSPGLILRILLLNK